MCFEPNEWLQANVAALRKREVDLRASKKDWHPTEDDLLNAGCTVYYPEGEAFKDGAMVATRDFGRWAINKHPSRKPRFRVKALSVKATS